MIQPISKFSDGPICAISRSSSDQDELWGGFFDFALLGSSWDSRSIAITKCSRLTFGTAVEIAPFSEHPADSLATRHDAISEFCRSKSHHFYPEISRTSDLDQTYARVRGHFLGAVNDPERREAARLFIDVSTCPRYFTLALLNDAFRSGLVSEIVVAYSVGSYPDASPSYDDLEDITFTDGTFQSIAVPGFLGEFEPRKSSFFLVSTGFDGWKTLNLLIRKEPGRVAALVASPGVTPDHEHRLALANAPLYSRFGIDDTRIVKASAGDAVEAWQRMSDAAIENFDNENVYYLCSGNKAHSVALALRAIVKETPTLLYNRPEQHLPSDIKCSGTYWSYSIAPTAGTVFG